MCIGLAILYQLRERLLTAEFNDCILLFSDLPAIDIEKCVKDSIHIFCTTPETLTWRKYGNDEDENREFDDLDIDSLTLAQQKREKVPRISGRELLELLGIKTASSAPSSRNRKSSGSAALRRSRSRKTLAFVLDVRSQDDFKVGSIPGSISAQASSLFDGEGNLIDENVIQAMANRGGKVVCVVGSQNSDEDALKVAESLLALNHNRVCVLHNGIEIFKTLPGVLCVPNA